MNILLIGSGGREHALAWKLQQSPRLGRLYVAPGNAGTAKHNIDLLVDDHAAVVAFARAHEVDMVLIGPEAPLAAGLADALQEQRIKVFGPVKAAAEIESSKAFAKSFMVRHNIPTARYQVFADYEAAQNYLDQVDYPVVIKASGLAAGKGVVLPVTSTEAQATLRSIMVDREFGSAGSEVVIEERLSGEEVSLLCFSDGIAVRAMPPAQDHKRLADGDTGPNTGGMGAYAPAPACPPDLAGELVRSILQPAIDGLRAEGRCFVGVLYAGLILTPDGPRVLEFNCRFGDPETQVLMPLLETDLVDILEACVEGHLSGTDIHWKSGAAVCVVASAPGYPGHYPVGAPIAGLGAVTADSFVFMAGAQVAAGQTITSGGRVLAAAGWGSDLSSAVDRAYRVLKNISFEAMHYRRDIAIRALGPGARTAQKPSAYAEAGVDIDAGNRTVALIGDSVRSTYGPEVLAGIGAFGGLYAASALAGLREPVLVASIDGVGTKVRLAARAGMFEGLGQDLVNHCINDILVQGARPLFFLDYVATSRLEPGMVTALVAGMAAACRLAGCALLGGETAEMPGVYGPQEFDLAGTIVGVVDRARILPRADLKTGDVIVGLASSGPHTNGYSLIQKVFQSEPLDTVFPELGRPLAEVLLTPHRSYLPVLAPLLDDPLASIKALAHITGGGLIENVPRVLPAHLDAVIDPACWPRPALFKLIQERGHIEDEEMFRVFNMGIGMVAILSPDHLEHVESKLPESCYRIGRLVAGSGRVALRQWT